MSVTKLADRLYIGSAPMGRVPFDVVVLCAAEYQPKSLPGSIILRIPLRDETKPLPDRKLAEIQQTANEVAYFWKKGNSVLVSCVMGRNRSALISALSLSVIFGGPLSRWAHYVRKTRRDALGVHALQNAYYWDLLTSQGRRSDR